MSSTTSDGQTQIRGKCLYWRERMEEHDRWDPEVKPQDKRVLGSCFVEGRQWPVTVATLPEDCPARDHCRYYIQMY